MAAKSAVRPILHYFNLQSLGRGEVVRLFLKDAGIDYEDIRYSYDDTWPKTRENLRQKGLALPGHLPVLEYDGKIMTQHLSILRFFSRELGKYDGVSSYEKYVVDSTADIYNDWRAAWVANLGNKNDKYKNETTTEFYKLMAQFYGQQQGPYLLGDTITYVDFAVYQAIDNDSATNTLPENLPEEMQKLKQAMESRPNIAKYLSNGRK